MNFDRQMLGPTSMAILRGEPLPGPVQPVVGRLHDPDVLRGIIFRNTMQRLSADDEAAPMYVTAQDMQDSINIAAEMRQANTASAARDGSGAENMTCGHACITPGR